MNIKKLIIPIIAVFVFIFGYEYVVHGVLLKGAYEETAQLWRTAGEYKMLYMLISQISFAVIVAYIFTLKHENKGIGEGIRYGLYIGLILGSVQIATYSYMPISLTLMMSWVVVSILKGVGSGIVLALTYKG